MAARRTQKQKNKASVRRLTEVQIGTGVATKGTAHLKVLEAKPAVATARSLELQKLLVTDISLLKRDILKTVAISLLLFAIIFGIVIYLS